MSPLLNICFLLVIKHFCRLFLSIFLFFPCVIGLSGETGREALKFPHLDYIYIHTLSELEWKSVGQEPLCCWRTHRGYCMWMQISVSFRGCIYHTIVSGSLAAHKRSSSMRLILCWRHLYPGEKQGFYLVRALNAKQGSLLNQRMAWKQHLCSKDE